MFSKHAMVATRIASLTIAMTMTLAMLLSINVLATGEAHAHQLSQAHPSTTAECVHA